MNYMLPRHALLWFALGVVVPTYASDWLSFGGDPQRTGWAQGEKDINPSNAKDLTLLWKASLDNQPRELNSLTAAVAAEWVVTPNGMKEIVVVGGASDNLFALDAETGTLIWRKTFTPDAKPKQGPFWLCPNALNATPLIAKRGLDVMVYTISSDGKLHALDIHNGEDKTPPVQFVPPFSKNWSLGLYHNVLYTTTSQGCNGAKSGVYAMDLGAPDKKIAFFLASPNGAGVWGRAGAVISPSGFVYAQTGDGEYDPSLGKFPDTILQLSGRDLKLVDYFTPSNHSYLTRKDLDSGSMSAVYFRFKDWEYLGSGGAGARWLAVPALGVASTKAPPFAHVNGDAPNGSIMAFQVQEKDGKPTLTPAWISRDMNAPDPPIVANGVVYAVSTGEFNRQWKPDGGLFNSKERAAQHTGNAILYAS
jgi:hypothetical protein